MYTKGQKNVMTPYIQAHLSSWVCTSCATTSINDNATATNVEMFPNPATNELTIKNENLKEGQKYKIINPLGSEILSGKIKNKEDQIDISGLSKGVYFFVLLSNESSFISKFVKE
jgi:hypothetical protein